MTPAAEVLEEIDRIQAVDLSAATCAVWEEQAGGALAVARLRRRGGRTAGDALQARRARTGPRPPRPGRVSRPARRCAVFRGRRLASRTPEALAPWLSLAAGTLAKPFPARPAISAPYDWFAAQGFAVWGGVPEAAAA